MKFLGYELKAVEFYPGVIEITVDGDYEIVSIPVLLSTDIDEFICIRAIFN